MAADRILMLKLLGDTSSMDKSLRKSEGRMKSFGRTVARWGTAVVADLAITGVEKLTDAIGEAWTGFREGEKASAQLGTTWRNLGLDGSKLSGTIERISDSTLKLGTDDTEAIMAYNRALQATGGKPAQAMQRLKIAQDLVANGSAPNLTSAMGLIQQAAKGSARVVDRFGLKSKDAAGRVEELGNKVRGAARKAAQNDPVGVLENQINEHMEGIVGAISKGELKDALAELEGIGTDVSAAWDKVGPAVTTALDKMSGGGFSSLVSALQDLGDRFLPKVRMGFEKLGEVFGALQPHVQNALTAIRPLVDMFSSSVQGSLAFVLDAINGVLDTVATALTGDFSRAFDTASEAVGTLATDIDAAMLGIPSAIADAVGSVGTEATRLGQELLNKVIDNANLIPRYLVNILVGEDGIVGKLVGAVQTIKNEALKVGQGIFDGIVNTVLSIPDVVVGVIRSAVNRMIDVWNSLDFRIPPFTLPGVPKVVVPDPLGGAGFEVFGGTGPTRIFSGTGDLIPDIPHLAKGGIVRDPTLALVGEAGPEAVVPLGRGGGMGNTYNVTVNVAPGGDMVEAGRQMVRAIQQYERRSGHVWRR